MKTMAIRKQNYISHMDEETKSKTTKLWKEIEKHGDLIKSEWDGDYLVATYKYNNRIYELIENMELGIKSEIAEYIEKNKEVK